MRIYTCTLEELDPIQKATKISVLPHLVNELEVFHSVGGDGTEKQ